MGILPQLKAPTRKERRAAKAARRRTTFAYRLKKKMRAAALERYGLDEVFSDGRPHPENRRVMRNARKAERQLPPKRFPATRAPGCKAARQLAIAGKRPRHILRQHAATCDACRKLVRIGND